MTLSHVINILMIVFLGLNIVLITWSHTSLAIRVQNSELRQDRLADAYKRADAAHDILADRISRLEGVVSK